MYIPKPYCRVWHLMDIVNKLLINMYRNPFFSLKRGKNMSALIWSLLSVRDWGSVLQYTLSWNPHRSEFLWIHLPYKGARKARLRFLHSRSKYLNPWYLCDARARAPAAVTTHCSHLLLCRRTDLTRLGKLSLPEHINKRKQPGLRGHWFQIPTAKRPDGFWSS